MNWRSTSTGGGGSQTWLGREYADEWRAADAIGQDVDRSVAGPNGNGGDSLSGPKRLFHLQRRGSTALSPGREGSQHSVCAGLDHACLDLGTPDCLLRPALSRPRLGSSLPRQFGTGDRGTLPEPAGSGHQRVDPTPGTAPDRPGWMVDGSLAGLDRRGAVWDGVARRGGSGR